MSVHVSSFVWKHSETRLGDRLVLLCLADKADENGRNVFPSVRTIARETRLSERAVQLALKNLRDSGRITRAGKHVEWKTTMYEIRMDAEAEAGVVVEGGADIAPRGGADPSPTGGAGITPKPFLTAEPSFNPSSLEAVLSEGEPLGECLDCTRLGHQCDACRIGDEAFSLSR